MKQETKFKQTEIGIIPEEWDIKPVSEVSEISLGGTPKTSITKYWNGDIKWASAKDVSNCKSRYICNTERTVTKEGIDNSAAKILPENTIVITSRGTVGELALLSEPMSFNQTCYGLKAKENMDSLFLYYNLKNSINRIKSISYGTVFSTITVRTFDEIKLTYPTLNEQNSIAKILSDLDSKIELLQKQNKTLEAIAQAIFKHWFVDFEFPNEEGKPYKSSGGAMVFKEEQGKEIPTGWEVGNYKEIVSVSTGKGLKRDEFVDNGKYPVLGANGELGRTDNHLFNERLILTGRVGTLGTVYLVNDKVWISDNVLISQPLSEETYYFAYFTIKRFNFQSLNRGSTQPLITQTDLKNQDVIIPDSRNLKEFHHIICSLFNKIDSNKLQIQSLQKIRDSLLPKLMSGKIRVPVEVE